MKAILFLLLIDICYCAIDCTYTGSGTKLDFTPLKNTEKDYHIAPGPEQVYDYWLNLCTPLVDNRGPACNAETGICQAWYGDYPGKASLGQAPTLTFSSSEGIVYAKLGKGTMDRTSTISLLCEPSAGVGSPQFVAEEPKLNYHFEWKTSYACTKCSPFTDCKTCALNGTCKWCLDQEVCVPKEDKICKSYVENTKYCPPACSAKTDCDSCITNSCSWCLSTKECISPNGECSDRVSDKKWCNLKTKKPF